MPRRDPKEELKRYEEAKSLRSPYESDMRIAAFHCLPRQTSGWQMQGAGVMQAPSQSARLVYDSTGFRSLPKYVSILNRILTPEGQKWAKLKASNPDLNKVKRVQTFLDELNRKLFQRRYDPKAAFVQTNGELFQSLGVYGMGPITIEKRRPTIGNKRGGNSYRAWPMYDVFVLVNDQGAIDTIFRRYWLNARNVKNRFPDDELPAKVAAEANKPGGPSETTMFEFVQIVQPNFDYVEGVLDSRRHPVRSDNICVADAVYVGKETGFSSMPMLTPRVATVPGDAYAFSPAMQAMPALGTVSAQKKTLLKQGHKAVDPAILAADDGSLSGRVDMRPGAVNYGALNGRGEALLKPFQTGTNWQVAEKLIEDERADIQDSFFVTLFQILNETPEMTATEVVERVAEKASLLAPTMGRLQTEYVGPMIEREIAILADEGLMGELPPELREAEGEYEIVYTSPLAKGMYAEDLAGFMRWQEMLTAHATATGTTEAMDWVDIDEAAPITADYLSVPSRFVRSIDQVKKIREDRSDQTSDQQLLDAAPSLASVAKATMDKGTG